MIVHKALGGATGRHRRVLLSAGPGAWPAAAEQGVALSEDEGLLRSAKSVLIQGHP